MPPAASRWVPEAIRAALYSRTWRPLLGRPWFPHAEVALNLAGLSRGWEAGAVWPVRRGEGLWLWGLTTGRGSAGQRWWCECWLGPAEEFTQEDRTP